MYVCINKISLQDSPSSCLRKVPTLKPFSVKELQSNVGDTGEASGKNVDNITVEEEEEEAPSRKYPEALAIFPQTPQSKTGPSTPTSTFT